MPRRLRRPKRRFDSAAEIEAWWQFFSSGYDFFGELQEIGVYQGHELEKRDLILAAAKIAWRRLGADYMAHWEQMSPVEKSGKQMPWAHEQFGAPSCR